ncbi:MAG: DUF3667 domain-containing protein [Rhizomicrobium sp.]
MDDLEAILEVGGAAAVELAALALAERGTKTGVCTNCGKPLLGAYCAVCGQPAHTHRRSVRALVHDFVVDFINFDSRILRTARALLFQPGELPCAFREGRTQRYVPAIRLYLFVSLIFFVLLSVSGIAILQLQVVATPVKIVYDAKGNAFLPNPAYDKDDPDSKTVSKLVPLSKEKANQPGGHFSYSTDTYFFARVGAFHSTMTTAAKDRLLESIRMNDKKRNEVKSWWEMQIFSGINRLASDPAALNGPLTDWLPRVMFLLLPLYALLLALFHIRRRKDYYLVDHLVFSLSVHTFTFVVLIAAAGLAQVASGELVALALLGVLSLYIFLAMKRFYRQGWGMTTIKFILISVIYTIFFLLPAMAVILAVSFFGGSLG